MNARPPARVIPISQANWRGLRVKVIDATPGRFEDPPRPEDRLMIHLGAPARTTGGYDGRGGPRVQSRGDMDFIPAGSGGLWDDEDPTSTMSIWFCPSLLKTAAKGADRCFPPSPRTGQRDVQMFRLALILEEEARNTAPADPLFIDAIAAALVARLAGDRDATDRAVATATLSGPKRRRVLDFIDENLGEEITIAELAAAVDLSPSHFRVLFRQTLRRPVHRYIVERRVHRARMLLEGGHASISQAALESGFCHQSHMARHMRQVLGLTPSELARS
ncbi:MAG: AraC family transcriptional regulator [Pseudomonadota bacterium]|nr:AraC family transcriptional regulator [Pseudomonadota bacterium]